MAVVARRHQVSESLLYNWRSAWKAATGLVRTAEPAEFVPIGVIGREAGDRPVMLAAPAGSPSPTRRTGMIEVELPDGVRVRVDAFVSEKALRRVLRAMKGSA